ncbi:wall-associated receptor kinase 3 [Phtheirospermum japonicum]|uniref:Wall-associated receptor kinase 3 n=1 Tax=Phtheirospermum japonicum TaxID=374723 RepID=A0A830B3B1_9LAMI|nr:wall-associated receptor kinase 3 [Phtheirospermum japonicum]
MPMVTDWAIGNDTNCEMAQMDRSSYACKGANAVCKNRTSNGYGYRCFCKEGYQGNPYLDYGCQDIDECEIPNLNTCEKKCVNTPGGFSCTCPKWYHGDGKRGGKGCIRGYILEAANMKTGISLGVILLLLVACWFHLELKKRRLIRMRQKFFIQNGGMLLQEQLIRRERSSSDTSRIFSEFELQKATDNFNNNMIIGQGGFGTVYKGLLPDNRIVAIKKSKAVDPNQIEQFINETQVPLLVYEFISNGTLYEHVHNKAKARSLSWDLRLKLATETAGVLSYLHSSASTPIIHRDVKSANILLDHTFTAKVSDFGASKLVPLDHTQISTMVQGTLGYLDPEYLQTNQLTEKSDVYSFGVVLVELLTGMRAMSFDRPGEEISLAKFFLSVMKQKRLLHVLEDNVAREGNKERVMRFAELARSCLNVKGDDRPSMKEVAGELEGLRVGAKHSWVQSENNAEDMEFLLGDGFSGITKSVASGFSIGFDSVRDHTALSVDGGR